MAALVLDERIYETSVTTGTGEYTLAGAVTGFQPCSVLTNGNYGYFFITDDTNWEVVIGTYVSGPDRLQRTAVLASSNGDAAVNWGSGTKKIRCGLPAFFAVPRQTSKSVAGNTDVTLTALEQRVQQLELTGILTGSISVIVDTSKWWWVVYNNTSGAFTLTVKTASGTGIAVTQGKRMLLYCDGTNVVAALDDAASIGAVALTGSQTVAGVKTFSSKPVLPATVPSGNEAVSHTNAVRMAVKAIYGFTYANNGSDPTNDIDIAAGGAMDSTGAFWITGSALTKRLDAAWAVGTNQGGLDTGSIGNSDYYIWAIARSDTGVVDYLFSLSATAPTMPANYDYKRLIGWFKRVSATIVPFHTYELSGGGIELKWDSPTLDISLAATLTTSRRTDAVKVPLDFSTMALLKVYAQDTGANFVVNITNPDEADAAASASSAPGMNLTQQNGAQGVGASMWVRTSSAGLIASRSDLATVDNYRVWTDSFQWSRR